MAQGAASVAAPWRTPGGGDRARGGGAGYRSYERGEMMGFFRGILRVMYGYDKFFLEILRVIFEGFVWLCD